MTDSPTARRERRRLEARQEAARARRFLFLAAATSEGGGGMFPGQVGDGATISSHLLTWWCHRRMPLPGQALFEHQLTRLFRLYDTAQPPADHISQVWYAGRPRR